MRRLILLVLLLSVLSGAAYGAGLPEEYRSIAGLEELENAVPPEARDVLSDYDFQGGGDVQSVFSQIGARLWKAVCAHFSGAARSSAAVLAVAILCGLAAAFYPDSKAPGHVNIAGVLAIAAAVLTESGSFLQTGIDTLERLQDFSTILMPCLAGAAAAGGAAVSASAKYAATMMFMNFLLLLCNRVFVPLISMYLACVVAQGAFQSSAFSAMAGVLKWLCVSGMTLLVVVFTAYLSISGVIAASGDMVTTRFAKAAISTALPVVGRLISDAASTVMAGMSLVKSTIGVFGVIAVVCVSITPFVSMGLRYLLFKMAAAAAGIFPDNRFTGLIDGIGTAFGLMLAMTGTGALILFISLISFIKAVTG